MQQRKLKKFKEAKYTIIQNKTKFKHTTENFISKVLPNMRKLNIFSLNTIILYISKFRPYKNNIFCR